MNTHYIRLKLNLSRIECSALKGRPETLISSTFLSISTPVFAATTVDAYMVDFPRDGDSNYSATAWGHSATSLMGGWRFLNSKYTTVHSIGTYNGQVSYCIEPGIGQNAGDTLSHKDETFWENYPSHLNPTISPDTIKVLLGRIMQYGYQGNVDEHHELSMILDRLEANASEAMAKGIRAIRLSAEGYSHAEIGSILGESDKCVAARISRTRKYLRSHPDLAAF